MSKQPTNRARPLPKRPKPRQGAPYLFVQMQELMKENDFVVDADEANIAQWTVGLPSKTIRQGCPTLAVELERWAKQTRRAPCIVLEIEFPMDYPHTAPFLRVVRPRFKWHTGHVTIGGSLCTEMLTPAGWREMTVEALMRSVCEILRDGEAKIKFLPDEHCVTPLVDYNEHEARIAYQRVAEQHGWIRRAAPALHRASASRA